MIDEKKLLLEIQKLHKENDRRIKETEEAEDDTTYYIGKNTVYIEVKNIISDLTRDGSK